MFAKDVDLWKNNNNNKIFVPGNTMFNYDDWFWPHSEMCCFVLFSDLVGSQWFLHQVQTVSRMTLYSVWEQNMVGLQKNFTQNWEKWFKLMLVIRQHTCVWAGCTKQPLSSKKERIKMRWQTFYIGNSKSQWWGKRIRLEEKMKKQVKQSSHSQTKQQN